MAGSRMNPDELRQRVEAALPKLRAIAEAAARRFREPRPSPGDLIAEVVERFAKHVLRHPDREFDSVEAYLVTTLRNVIRDIYRRGAREPLLPGELPDVATPSPDTEPADRAAAFECAFAKLDRREQCVLRCIHLDDKTGTVPTCFKDCGWSTKSWTYEHRKLKDKFRDLFEQCMEAA